MFPKLLSKNLGAALFALLTLVFGVGPGVAQTVERQQVDTVLLLVPDSANLSDPGITVWLDAAREEGLHVRPITDSQFLALPVPAASQYVGLILPDQVHVNASNEVVNAVTAYVNGGGKLLLTYDAGIKTPVDANGNDFYTVPASRFSPLAGVNYSLYEALRGNMIGFGHIVALESTWRRLLVPPGKSMLYPTAVQTADPVQGMTSYYYGFLNYPSFITEGAYNGSAVITSPSFGLVAGVNNYGNGRVLFVNTPLGYLKRYGTDGLLLHGFLRYFAVNMLQLPYLSPLPQGRAGMVINVHTDCGNSLAEIQRLDKVGFWNSGPYSIDFTAGPDCIDWGDKLGLDVPGNPTTQSWIQTFVNKGHEVGAHGGWIHDFYGLKVREDNQKSLIVGGYAPNCSGPLDASGTPQCSFHDLVVINKQFIDRVLQTVTPPRKVREYAAPEGNTPKWSVEWLEQNGVVGYYWVGDTGMAPTRGYREGQLFTKQIWAHPLTPYGTAATFEEFSASNISAAEASAWLTGIVDFSVKYRTSRMIYFHEPGVTGSDTGVSYLKAVQDMLSRAKNHGTRFSWYTMAALSDFLSDRDTVSWTVSQLSDGTLQIDAASPKPLGRKSWVLTKARYAQPVAVSNVTVTNDPDANEWIVTANDVNSASFTVKPLTPLL